MAQKIKPPSGGFKWAVSIKPYPTRDSTRIAKSKLLTVPLGSAASLAKKYKNYFNTLQAFLQKSVFSSIFACYSKLFCNFAKTLEID